MSTEGKGPIVIPCYLIGGVPYVLEVDAAGKLAVRAVGIETLLAGGLPAALDSGALKVKEQGTVTVQAAGADKLFAMESVVEGEKTNFDLPAGEAFLNGDPVPAGKIWVITAVCSIVASATATELVLIAIGLAGDLRFFHQKLPVNSQWYVWNGQLILQVGDYISADILGASLHDAAILRYGGYQMDAP